MLKEGDEVAAFVGDEVRGATTSLYVEALDLHLLFLTVYANEDGETLTFKYADSETGIVHDLLESFNFEINANMGTVDEPQILNLDPTTSVDNLRNEISLRVVPNPFRGSANIAMALPANDLITIRMTDVVGNSVREMRIHVNAGRSWIELDANDDDGSPLPMGVYFISIEGDFGYATEKVLILE